MDGHFLKRKFINFQIENPIAHRHGLSLPTKIEMLRNLRGFTLNQRTSKIIFIPFHSSKKWEELNTHKQRYKYHVKEQCDLHKGIECFPTH